jgi:DNA-binding GntR family transcriptional regulator
LDSLQPSKSLINQAYEAILAALCDGTFSAGERVTQEAIAARLKVSRQPVTHALAILKSQGFFEASGRQGLIVTELKPELFEAIYQLRSVLEPLAIRLGTHRLTEGMAAHGRAILARGNSAIRAADGVGSLQADMDFHSFIYELSGNPLIAETMRLHWYHIRRGMGRVLRRPGVTGGVWQEHERILEAMIKGDADGAASAMRAHIVEAYERVRFPQPEKYAGELKTLTRDVV